MRGFTLIELLVIMGIVASIAVFVIVTINPFEQLRRSRDSARMQATQQLVKALQAYNLQTNTWPINSTTWMNTLKTANELPSIPQPVARQYSPFTCDGGTNQFDENGFCYNISPSVPNHIAVWVELEAQKWQNDCNVNFPPPTYPTTLPTWVYTSALGRSGVACIDSTKGVNSFTDDTNTANIHYLPGQGF